MPRTPGRTGYPTRYTDIGLWFKRHPAAMIAPQWRRGGEIETMDERDFVEQTDYTAWSLSDLLHEIEQHADMMRGASRYNLSYIMEPATALAARAEETAALRAELDALKAATEWQPVTENRPSPGYYLTYHPNVGTDVQYWTGYDSWVNGAYGRQPTYWRPLPPDPDKADEVQQ